MCRIIFFIVNILHVYFGFLFNAAGVHNLFYLFLFCGMIIYDFKYSEMAYAFVIEEGFNHTQDYIELAISFVRENIDKHFASVWSAIKLTISSIVVMAIDALPKSVTPYTDLLFGSIKSYK